MDPLVRRRAKAINFGIIYGISAFGLANQLGIGQPEARDYIAKYFQRYPGIRDYMETTKDYARKNGYVKTPFGRKIHLKYINEKNQGMRAFSERAAINAPLQGGAASRDLPGSPPIVYTYGLRRDVFCPLLGSASNHFADRLWAAIAVVNQ